MSFLKPILIAVIIILALLIIVKANRFATSDQPSNERPKDPVKPEKKPEKPNSQTPIEFFLVYVGRRVPVTHYPFTIGSRNDNDLIITDSTVSRQHAELFRKNGQNIGLAMTVIYLTEDRKQFILEFCVFPEFRGNGTGKACARALLDWGKANGARFAELNADDPRRTRFWASFGFIPNGRDR